MLGWRSSQHIQADMLHKAVRAKPMQPVRSDVVPLLAQRLHACYRVAALAIALQLLTGCGTGCEACQDTKIHKPRGACAVTGLCCGASHFSAHEWHQQRG